MAAWGRRLRYLFSLGVTSRSCVRRICLSYPLPACAYSTNGTLRLPFCVPPSLKRLMGGTGISTSCPSPTPFGLGLGPDLPWADEPSPGNLRLSAGRILTCLFAYSYRHYLFPPLHHPFQDDFYAVGTLPYPCLATCRDFGVRLEPREFSAQGHSTSELLRTL